MKIVKFLASFAMAGALTAVCASGVFADSVDICSDYTEALDDTPAYVTVAAGENYTASGDYTVVVISEEANEKAELAGSDILQIDQNSSGEFTLNFDGLEDGLYYVRLGGAETGYVYDTFTVGEVNEPEQVYIGDVNNDEVIALRDYAEIAKYLADSGSTVTDSDKNWYAAAYCNGDNVIAVRDYSEIAKFLADSSVDYVDKTVDIGTYGEKPVE